MVKVDYLNDISRNQYNLKINYINHGLKNTDFFFYFEYNRESQELNSS